MRVYTQLLSSCMNEFHDKLFDFYYEMPDDYKPIFERKFLLRYGYRNIGFESYVLFKQMLESKLNDLMPKYLDLYSSVDVKYNPFINNNIKINSYNRNRGRNKFYEVGNNKNISGIDSSLGVFTDGKRGTTSTSSESNLSTDLTNAKNQAISDEGSGKISLFSDTPQESIGSGEIPDGKSLSDTYFNDGYITTKQLDKDSSTKISSDNNDVFSRTAGERGLDLNENISTYENSITEGKVINRHQNYSDVERVNAEEKTKVDNLHEMSLRGVLMSDVIIAWRKSFISVDKMLLDELDELFIGVF